MYNINRTGQVMLLATVFGIVVGIKHQRARYKKKREKTKNGKNKPMYYKDSLCYYYA